MLSNLTLGKVINEVVTNQRVRIIQNNSSTIVTALEISENKELTSREIMYIKVSDNVLEISLYD